MGHQAIINGRIQNRLMPLSTFLILTASDDEYNRLTAKNSTHMVHEVYARDYWHPSVILSPKDFVSKCDFSFANGLFIQADLGDDYERGFKYAMAIAEHSPTQLIANMGAEHPLLMWNEFKGFYE